MTPVTTPLPATPTQRLFFALWPPAELSRELHRLAGNALRGGAGRRVAPENIHLTLAFLGSVNASFRECAEQAATAIRATSFTLMLEQMGYWPKPGILWAGPNQTPSLLIQLVQELNAGLVACGYDAEKRPYAAHLTLARKTHLHNAVASMEPRAWEINRFHLVRSHTHAGGARYEILRSWPLNSPAA
ncbi:2'-5' RNA ligase [Sulfuricaulis limicola]|uniref:RNA 2',3'-cyclic phosphodiesterase n=1 Tax=Sulfuricaulis limicola TaxID=1620215 RepID=A0A1B4XI95_9GAMM|nr:RNA 2',3'-cyclic phosphodiesterase [Sulfuricaulis limicola]BAV34527.1 2'-5' RNA ligase [Sulfuricaulis limicola]